MVDQQKDNPFSSVIPLTSVGVATLGILAGLPSTAEAAPAKGCQNHVSYMQTSSGRCINLSYLTALGRSRQHLENANYAYQRAIAMNYPRPSVTVTETVGGETSTTSFISNYPAERPTEVEWSQQEQAVQASEIALSEVAAINSEVEQWALYKHQQALNTISGRTAFSRPESIRQ